MISRIKPKLPLSPPIQEGVTKLDNAIVAAVNEANKAGIPTGLIVAVLHGHLTKVTLNMLD